MPRGGFRPNAGRKSFYGEKTVPVKIPKSRVEEVKAYLRQKISVTVSNSNSVSVKDSVTFSNDQTLGAIQSVVSQWRSQCPPERVNQPRWANVNRLLSELEGIFTSKS